jgi:hypothetical protein
MEALEATMNKNNINLDPPSNSSSDGHALSAFFFSFNETSTTSSND